MSHGITAALFAFSFVDDIMGDIETIDESIQLSRSHEHIYGRISDFIRLTGCRRFDYEILSLKLRILIPLILFVHRLIRYITDLYQIPLIIQFLGCTGAVCIGMLMIQISLIQVIKLMFFTLVNLSAVLNVNIGDFFYFIVHPTTIL